MADQLFSKEELEALLIRYAIGKKPLSLLLGWGETTILRYAGGLLPTGEFAAQLKRIAAEPLYYLSLLDANQERITPVAYRKSRAAVLELVTASKLQCAAWYLIGLADADCSPFQICTTMYYAQAISLGLYDTALFDEDCDISKSGEIPYARIYEHLKEQGIRRLPETAGLLEEKEALLLKAVYEILYQFGPGEIRALFLAEGAYIRKSRQEGGGRCMKNSAVAIFFKKVAQTGQFTKPEEFERYFLDRCKRKKARAVHIAKTQG